MPLLQSVGDGKPNITTDVTLVQTLLKKWPITAGGTPSLSTDGLWGPNTKSAVITFQTFHNGLSVDGAVDPGFNTISRLEAPNLPILLTFDDGPHAQDGAQNNTLQIVQILANNSTKDGIVGAFFVQTHSVAGRLGTARGRQVAEFAYLHGCPIAIHTGSDTDHTLHTSRVMAPAYDSNADGAVDGLNGLESDLIRAKLRIASITGTPPTFVRAVKLERNDAVNSTYLRVGLKHIGVNVYSKDNADPRPTADTVRATLTTGPHSVAHAISSNAPHLIVLFHDVNGITADNLESYIGSIAAATGQNNRFPKFIDTHADAIALLSTTTI